MFLRPGEIIKELKDKKYIIKGMQGADFGCGGGYFTSLLANEVGSEGKIFAIDVQEEALKEAQEFLKNLNIRNVKFVKANLEKDSTLEENFLDFVFISQVLYQSEKPEDIINEAKKVLKENGHLIILEPKTDNPLFLGQKTLSLDEILNLLKEKSFKIIETKTIGDYYLLIANK